MERSEINEAVTTGWRLLASELAALPEPINLGECPTSELTAWTVTRYALAQLERQAGLPETVVAIAGDAMLQWRMLRYFRIFATASRTANPRVELHKEFAEFTTRELALKIDFLRRWRTGELTLPVE